MTTTMTPRTSVEVSDGSAAMEVSGRYIEGLTKEELEQRVNYWLFRAALQERHYNDKLAAGWEHDAASPYRDDAERSLSAALFWDDCLAGRKLHGCGYCHSYRGDDDDGRCLACGGL